MKNERLLREMGKRLTRGAAFVNTDYGRKTAVEVNRYYEQKQQAVKALIDLGFKVTHNIGYLYAKEYIVIKGDFRKEFVDTEDLIQFANVIKRVGDDIA